MRSIAPISLSFVLVLACCVSVVAQEFSKPRKFKTTYKIDMYAEAGVSAKKIGTIPASVILEALEDLPDGYACVKRRESELENKGGTIKGVTGKFIERL